MANNDDKYENFVKETWSNLKFAIALVFSLIIIFGLGAYYTVVQDKVNFAYGFIFWVLATLASIGISVLIIFIIREYKINHFWKWGDSWKNEAFNTLQFLQKTAAKENYIIFSPKDYSELLDVTRKDTPTEEIQNIYLLGSMTGFLLLLPISLRNHICITNCNVTIDIIGSTEKTGTEKYQNLKSYPIAFVVKTMILLLECCDKFKTKDQTVTFNLYHFPYDIMEALFIIGDKKLVNVQSLDPNNVNIIFENQQIGVLLSSEKNNEQFVRYRDTYTRIKSKLASEKETWELSSYNNSITLKVTGKSYLRINTTDIEYMETIEDINKSYSNHDVLNFLKELYGDSKSIYKDSISSSKLKKDNSKLHQIDTVLRSYPNLSKQPCTCGFTIK